MGDSYEKANTRYPTLIRFTLLPFNTCSPDCVKLAQFDTRLVPVFVKMTVNQ